MDSGVEKQRKAFENDVYDGGAEKWSFHDTKDPLVRYLRDRRVKLAVEALVRETGRPASTFTALVACGGVGGEGTLLANLGFRKVVVSDFSENALAVCRQRDPRLETLFLNAESMDLPDEAFDIVLVQDGLHHLPRPALGFTEMLRVARVAAVVIEPHTGFVGRRFGTDWEEHGGTINFVFRWNRSLVEQVTRSYLLKETGKIQVMRIWDHGWMMQRISRFLGSPGLQLLGVRAIYSVLNALLWWIGNMMVAVVMKPSSRHPDREQEA